MSPLINMRRLPMRLSLIMLLFFTFLHESQAGLSFARNGASACPLPNIQTFTISHVEYYMNCQSGDTVWLSLFWGDGTQTDTFDIIDYGFYCTFSINISHQYTMPGFFEPLVIATFEDESVLSKYCLPFQLAPDCRVVSGNVYIDQNSNCSSDTVDIYQSHIPVILTNQSNGASFIGFSDSNGNYRIDVPAGSIDYMLFHSAAGFIRTCPDSDTILLSGMNDTVLSIGVECDPASSNYLVAMHGPRIGAPGNLGNLDIYVRSRSCYSDYLDVKLDWDSVVVFEGFDTSGSGFIGPDSVVGRSAYWHLLAPAFNFQNHGSIYRLALGVNVKLRTDTSATMNQPCTISLSCEEEPYESHYDDNVLTRTRHVGLPIDPNNKLVTPEGIDTNGRVLPGTTFTYTINFQNTGNAPARHVFIMDTLPEHLDLSTIEIIGSRHDMKVSSYSGKILRFDFFDINLPDSTTDEPGSHGWVIFQIGHKDVPLGTRIKNRVGIYFDYNAPVITNYALNTIDTFPYPLQATVQSTPMTCNTTPNGSVSAVVTSGNGPYAFLWNNGSTLESIQDLAAGAYTVTITERTGDTLVLHAVVEHNPIHPDPEIGAFSGPEVVQAWQTYVHTVTATVNCTYQWDALVGEVLESSANSVKVLWHAGPEGTLIVNKKNEFGCISLDSTAVPILFVGQDELSDQEMIIYPNPAGDQLCVSGLSDADHYRCMVTDMQGKVLRVYSLQAGDPCMDVAMLPAGNFQLVISAGDENLGVHTFVKQ